MFKKRFNLVLMAALGAALSSGGTAIDAGAPEFPNDGKFRVRSRSTGQVNEFDTIDQADNFGRTVENPDDWELVGEHARPSNSELIEGSDNDPGSSEGTSGQPEGTVTTNGETPDTAASA